MVVSNSSSFSWIGPQVTNENLPPMGHKNVAFFRKCIFGSLTLKVGDYVLISNADAAEPDTVEGCDIAKILHMYEDEGDQEDPYRVIVQWYSRPAKVPHKLLHRDDVVIDFDLEVIEDHRPFDTDVSIETIFDKCVVICSELKTIPSYVLQQKRRSMFPMFICRYKLVRLSLKDSKYKLIPILENPDGLRTRNTPCTPKEAKSATKTPKSASKTRRSLVKTPKSKVPEFEFIDVSNAESVEKMTVSPFKIINNSVVKAKKGNAVDGGRTPNGVRRNLNMSLDKEVTKTVDSDVLNYSIVNHTPEKTGSDELKIKLRLSASQKKSEGLQRIATRRRSSRLSTDTSAPEAKIKRTLSIDEPLQSKEKTPKKQNVENSSDPNTPKSRVSHTPRRSILKTPNSRQSLAGTPKRNIQLSNIVEEVVFNENDTLSTPVKRKSPKTKQYDSDSSYEPYTPKKRKATTPSNKTKKKNLSPVTTTPSQKIKNIRTGSLTPSIGKRPQQNIQLKSDLQLTRERLHISAIPDSLPCREEEFKNIYMFVEGKLQDQCGGCMYISGVPGTGKTATVTAVIRSLKNAARNEDVPEFEFIEINGMRLTEPRQAYVQIYKQLTGKSLSWEHAHSLLEKRFMTPSPRRVMTVLLVDELDILCNRRQDVVYNLLDWPAKSAARLVVITIANTMDLPERLLMGKVTSRLGLTRLTFQPYSHKQLQEIVTARLSGSDSFKSDAVQLVARKVAAVSGDARRALDICRRAAEIAEEMKSDEPHRVTMVHVQQALSEMIASAKVQAIKNSSKMEQIFLQSVLAEVTRTGIEETTFLNVYSQMESITAFMGVKVPTPGMALKICAKLGTNRLLICEHSRADIFQKILLNISSDDIHYALQAENS